MTATLRIVMDVDYDPLEQSAEQVRHDIVWALAGSEYYVTLVEEP